MLLDQLRQMNTRLNSLAAQCGASRLRVFGSVARDQAGPDSDIDLLVDLPEQASLFDRADLKVALEELLNHSVDLIRRRNLRPEMQAKVEAEAVPL